MPTITAKNLKHRADVVLEEVFRSLFEEIHTDRIKQQVAAMREVQPDFHPVDHARLLARRTAIRCAAAGAMTGLPSGLLALGTLGADLAYLIYQQFRLVVAIATIYGHEPTRQEQFNEALACLAYASGVGIGKQGVAALLESAAAETGVIAEKLGARFLRERLTNVVPLLGAVTAGALNYAAVQAVSRAAIRYYEALQQPAPDGMQGA